MSSASSRTCAYRSTIRWIFCWCRLKRVSNACSSPFLAATTSICSGAASVRQATVGSAWWFIANLLISYVKRKASPDLEHCLSATYGIRARPAPNSQNRKSLNSQEKIEQKSKVSKPSDVETVETVEGAEAARKGYKHRKL